MSYGHDPVTICVDDLRICRNATGGTVDMRDVRTMATVPNLKLGSWMMSAGVLNDQLVRRVVALAAALVRAEKIAEKDLSKVFLLCGADAEHQSAVRRALSQVGITVVPSAATGTGSRAERPRAPRAAIPVQRAAPSVPSTSGRYDHAAQAARVLIADDRRRVEPWNRVLTAEEEIGLAILMRGGAETLEQELPSGFRSGLPAGDERAAAFDAFVLHNLRLVWKIAYSWDRGDLEVEDLQQAGMFGLHRAVEMFDASRGWKFSTYATNWIKQKIGRTLDDEGRLIRIPVHVWESIRKIDRARARLAARQGYATLFDLSAETGFAPHHILELSRLRAGVVSLDTPIGEEGASTLGDLIGENLPLADPEAALVAAGVRAEVAEALAELPEREQAVLRHRMGFTGEPMTLDQIGERFGVTRERIRQIESKAKSRLRGSLSRRGLGRTGCIESPKV